MEQQPNFVQECYARIGKTEHPALLQITPEELFILFESPDIPNQSYVLSYFIAHRQHPKLPMLQLRFSSEDQKASDVTLVFKQRQDGSPQLENLKLFLMEFTQAYQHQLQVSKEKKTAKFVHEEPEDKPQALHTVQPASETSIPLKLEEEKKLETQNELSELGADDAAIDLDRLNRERALILEENVELAATYKILVEGQYLSKEQFWNDHFEELVANQTQLRPEENLFLAEPPQVSKHSARTESSSQKLTVAATDQQLQQILAEHPVIASLNKTIVPFKMPHEEFWARFFQSRYYAQMSGLDPIASADTTTFPEYNADHDHLVAPFLTETQADISPTVNLISSENFFKPGFGSVLGEGSLVGEQSQLFKHSRRRAILDRFTLHGIQAIKKIENAQTPSLIYAPLVQASKNKRINAEDTKKSQTDESPEKYTVLQDLMREPMRKPLKVNINLHKNKDLIAKQADYLEDVKSSMSQQCFLARLKIRKWELVKVRS